MRFAAATTTFLLTPAALAFPSPWRSGNPIAERATAQDREVTDRYLFDTALSDFLDKSRAKDPATLDWTNDGCSLSPDKPAGFDFLSGCIRHDFGYRNYKAQGRFTLSAKKKIDDQFQKDKAAVYAAVVRSGTFGAGPGKRGEGEETPRTLEEAVAECNKALEGARREGLLLGPEYDCTPPVLVD
ncbi:hypothetical protein JDV02_004669 [Purpureocillium takamizusanense]|uniref:Uncharacterized protein n=1 Tax=Purpureocillium takamizusanense TaxID=2060973 RepID=A0A9Q8QEC4_9HYPO|nr:uncharacterized protein JDV02_004669 [Purpureocillium takamizusanense]UNI18398.1 hypothetical protein JDV02_004669 [Purpureocillium takamizusanense]